MTGVSSFPSGEFHSELELLLTGLQKKEVSSKEINPAISYEKKGPQTSCGFAQHGAALLNRPPRQQREIRPLLLLKKQCQTQISQSRTDLKQEALYYFLAHSNVVLVIQGNSRAGGLQ